MLSPIGSKSVAEGETLTFTVTATDPDGDALTYSASNLPVKDPFALRIRVPREGRVTRIAIEGLILIMKMPGGIAGPINPGNPVVEFSVLELAQKVIELTASISEIVFFCFPKMIRESTNRTLCLQNRRSDGSRY